jgi:hypothetical protein
MLAASHSDQSLSCRAEQVQSQPMQLLVHPDHFNVAVVLKVGDKIQNRAARSPTR